MVASKRSVPTKDVVAVAGKRSVSTTGDVEAEIQASIAAASSADGVEKGAIMVTCSTCTKLRPLDDCSKICERIRGKSDGSDATTYRCLACNALKGRVYRLLKQNPSLCEEWEKQTPEQRAEWFSKHHNSFGSQLKLAVTQQCEEVRRTSQTITFAASCDKLKSKKELEKIYKDTPGEAISIMDKARSTMHPTRNVMVWEDIDVQSSAVTTEHSEKSFKRSAETEEIGKPAKKQKALKEPKNPKAVGGGEEKEKVKTFSANHKLRLEKAIKQVDDFVTALQTLADVAVSPALQEFIAPFVLKKHKAALEELAAVKVQAETLVEANSGGINPFFASFMGFRERTMASKKSLQQAVAAAQEEVEENEDEEEEQEEGTNAKAENP